MSTSEPTARLMGNTEHYSYVSGITATTTLDFNTALGRPTRVLMIWCDSGSVGVVFNTNATDNKNTDSNSNTGISIGVDYNIDGITLQGSDGFDIKKIIITPKGTQDDTQVLAW